eukprot:GHVU01083213.1.p1 GENE.GHVU01083213.1~~GHVU01083213.1.p1  ORF type:complete len:181 (+),score=11.69 GHVU01083213.1:2937-3479(+)
MNAPPRRVVSGTPHKTRCLYLLGLLPVLSQAMVFTKDTADGEYQRVLLHTLLAKETPRQTDIVLLAAADDTNRERNRLATVVGFKDIILAVNAGAGKQMMLESIHSTLSPLKARLNDPSRLRVSSSYVTNNILANHFVFNRACDIIMCSLDFGRRSVADHGVRTATVAKTPYGSGARSYA